VVGLMLSALGYMLAAREVEARKDEQREVVADGAADAVAGLLAEVDTLVSGVEGTLIATDDAREEDVERLLDLLAERSELITSASLLNAQRETGLNIFGQTGDPQFVDLEAITADPDAAARVQMLAELAPGEVRHLGTTDEGTVGIATAFTTPGGDGEDASRWVVAVELDVPADARARLGRLEGSPRLAVELLEPADTSTLLFSTGADPDEQATERIVAIGASEARVRVQPTGDLLDPNDEALPLFVFVAGLALTALLTPLVGRLASRREEVRALSAQRDELDDALTASRRIEQELRSSEQRFRSVLQSSPDIVLWIDDGGSSIQVLNRDDFLGHPFTRLTQIDDLLSLAHPDDTDVARSGIERLGTAPAGAVTEFECRFERADAGWEWIRLRGGRVQHEGGGPILAVLTTVTEQKQEEARRAQLEAQLVQSQRLEAVGQLAGGVAHDFNNILAAIVSGAELVLDEVEGQPREDVEEIRRTARRGSDLARQLLLFSRRDRGSSPEVLQINQVVTEIETMLRRTLHESVELRTALADALYDVHIDPSQIERVLMNLTINARDAMPGGGTITITTENLDVDETYAATRPGLEPGPYVCLVVADTGAGMPEEVRRHAFEPFFSTKEFGKGTGLGLATVYGIVQGAQGYIQLDSEVGVGTTFTILLPRTFLGQQGAAAAPDDGEAVGGTERILLVEDEPSVREATRRLLEKAGYTITVAAAGQEALERAAADASDVLLTDILMPGGMNGREVARAVRKQQPSIAVLYMTGHSDDVLENVGIDEDEDEALVVRKPFTEGELLRAVRLAITRTPEPAS
jgi:PAS domain S-box-containing protein